MVHWSNLVTHWAVWWGKAIYKIYSFGTSQNTEIIIISNKWIEWKGNNDPQNNVLYICVCVSDAE